MEIAGYMACLDQGEPDRRGSLLSSIPETHRVRGAYESAPISRENSFFGSMVRIESAALVGSLLEADGPLISVAGRHYGSLRHSSLMNLDGPSSAVERKVLRMRQPPLVPAGKGGSTANKIPTSMSEITDEWVLMVVNQFRLSVEQGSLTMSAIKATRVSDCKKYVGDFSSTFQVDVTFSEPPRRGGGIAAAEDEVLCHYSFIAKLLPSDDPARACVVEANLLEKEIELYFELLPSMKQFLRLSAIKRAREIGGVAPQDEQAMLRAAIHSAPTFLDHLIPQCIFSAHNSDGAAVIVFKSCSAENYFASDDPEGLSLDEVNWVLGVMARFHAAGIAFISRTSVDTVLRRYPYLASDMYSTVTFMREVTAHLITFEKFLNMAITNLEETAGNDPEPNPDQFPNLDLDSLQDSKRLLRVLLQAETWHITAGLCRKGPASLTTICHGELWESNILLRKTVRDPDDANQRVKVVDWKNAKVSTCTTDLAFLMLSSTTYKLRAEHTRDILSSYHKTLCEHLEQMTSTVTPPTLDELEKDYYHSLEYALVQAICMLVQQMHCKTSEIDELSQSLIEETTGTAMDTDTQSEKVASEKHRKTFHAALETLKKYERRALNICRDLDLEHVEKFVQHCVKAEPSGAPGISGPQDAQLDRDNDADLSVLHDPDHCEM